MRKHLLLVLIGISYSLSACKQNTEVVPSVDNKQIGQTILTKRAEQMAGKWLISETNIAWKRFNPYLTELGITSDTVLRDLATLTIPQATKVIQQEYPQYTEFTTELACRLDYGGQSYPVFLTLETAIDNRNMNPEGSGKPVWMRLKNYSLSQPTPIPDTNALYFRKLGFFHVYYDQQEATSKTMRWRGYEGEYAIGLQGVKLTKQ